MARYNGCGPTRLGEEVPSLWERRWVFKNIWVTKF